MPRPKPGVEFSVSRSVAKNVKVNCYTIAVGEVVTLPDFGFDDDTEFVVVACGEYTVMVRAL